MTIHDMPEEDIRSGKYYDAWHWLWEKQKEQDEQRTSTQISEQTTEQHI